MSDFLNDATVRDHLNRAASAAATFMEWEARAAAVGALKATPCESPLEAIFVVWWAALTRAYQPKTPDVQVCLVPQHEVEVSDRRYRLDFQVVMRQPLESLAPVESFLPIGVELDGHTFHEKTPEQVAYRNERDRLLQMHGWRVFHFSGMELHREPERCIQSVYTFALDAARAALEQMQEAR